MEWKILRMERKWNGRKLQVWIMEKSSSIPFHALLVYERVRALAPLMRALIRVRARSGK